MLADNFGMHRLFQKAEDRRHCSESSVLGLESDKASLGPAQEMCVSKVLKSSGNNVVLL